MLWATWTIPPLVSSLVLCFAVLVIWAADPKVTHLNLLSVLVCLLLGLSVAPDRASAFIDSCYALVVTLIDDWRLDSLTLTHANMLVSGAAVIWLARRALQTLWKPVPELIDILGVEVPVPPDVSLTAIGADKATITWTHPPPNRPVVKYVIQVNGVNVGESATSHDTFITVSGLKPNHFYNVRIIAVGSNNFQAGSRVLRLRTFAPTGQPQLGSSRLPSDFADADLSSQPSEPAGPDENGNGNGNGPVRQFVTSTFGVAQPLPQDAAQALTRDGNSSTGLNHSSRRNTVNRRHSPSTTSLDQQPSAAGPGGEEEMELTEAQMAELNKQYLDLRKETEETAALILKEEEEAKKLLNEYQADKQAKRKGQKRKEEQTEKLKREQGSTERAMRSALQRRLQREKKLKEKVAELDRLRENIAKWDKGIQDMQEDQAKYNKQRAELEEERQKKANELRQSNKEAQAECSRLETELKEKRQTVKELEDAWTNQVSNGDDAEWRANILELRRAWQRTELEYRNKLLHETRRQQGLEGHISILSAQMQQIPHSMVGPYSPYNTPAPAGFDYDGVSAGPTQLKRRSRTNTSLSSIAVPSPAQKYSLSDLNAPPTSTPSPFTGSVRPPTQSGFLTGPFMGPSADHPELDDAAFKMSPIGAPLSPSATSLLPSNIFNDDEPTSPSSQTLRMSPFVPLHRSSPDHSSLDNGMPANGVNGVNGINGIHDPPNGNINGHVNGHVNGNGNVISPANDPQSPASSNRSMSILSSPRVSSQNLPFPVYTVDSPDGRPPQTGGLPSPTLPAARGQASHNARFGIFSFPRSRGAKALDEEGPALGSLKHGQSQSFPRQGDEAEFGNKSRRISLSSWSVFNRNSIGPEMLDGLSLGTMGMNKAAFSARNLFPFASRTNGIFTERDAGSPRPASVASTDMPRPSTDSSSIWGPPALDNGGANGGGATLNATSRLWPGDHAWPSRNPSRRPSMHGSPSALKTNLASAEDEILDEEELLNPETSPSQVGVIGSRPPASAKKASSSLGKALNPAAPTFMANIFRPKNDKDKDKTRGRDKDKDKEHSEKSRARSETPAPPSLVVADETTSSSPAASRRSRDGHSVRTQTSVSESRESLDWTVSNTASEPGSVGLLSSSKDSGGSTENAILKLFRKESSGKLSFTRRISRAKGAGSVAGISVGTVTGAGTSTGNSGGGGGASSITAGSEKNASVGRSSFGDLEDLGVEEMNGNGSATGSPSLGPSKSRDKTESRLKTSGSWFSIKKKSREKESLEMDRALDTESVSSMAATDDGEKRL